MDVNGCYLPRPTDSHLESLALAQGTQGRGIGCLGRFPKFTHQVSSCSKDPQENAQKNRQIFLFE